MSDSGSKPDDQPDEGPNPFSREGAADSTPGDADRWTPGAPPPYQPPPQQPAPPNQPPPFQPEPPYQPGYYGQPGPTGDPSHGQAGYGPPGYPADPNLPAGYGEYAGYGYGGGPVDHPKATPALVTGIIGMVLSIACGVGGLVGIAGVVLGSRAKREIDADPARWTGRSKASAGVVTGAIGLGILAIWLVIFVASVITY